MFAFGHFIALDFTQERRYQVQKADRNPVARSGGSPPPTPPPSGESREASCRVICKEFTPEDGSC